MTNQTLAYFILRITLGINILTHGAVRIAHYHDFVQNLMKQFTFLPNVVIKAFGYALPPLEIAIGTLLLLGFCTRFGAVVGALLIAVLIFGTSLRQEWNIVGLQMIYALTYFFILFYMNYNKYSIDYLLGFKSVCDGLKKINGSYRGEEDENKY